MSGAETPITMTKGYDNLANWRDSDAIQQHGKDGNSATKAVPTNQADSLATTKDLPLSADPPKPTETGMTKDVTRAPPTSGLIGATDAGETAKPGDRRSPGQILATENTDGTEPKQIPTTAPATKDDTRAPPATNGSGVAGANEAGKTLQTKPGDGRSPGKNLVTDIVDNDSSTELSTGPDETFIFDTPLTRKNMTNRPSKKSAVFNPVTPPTMNTGAGYGIAIAREQQRKGKEKLAARTRRIKEKTDTEDDDGFIKVSRKNATSLTKAVSTVQAMTTTPSKETTGEKVSWSELEDNGATTKMKK